MNFMTPSIKVCEGNRHGRSLVDSAKHGILSPFGYQTLDSKQRVKSSIYCSIVMMALSNTKHYMTTQHDSIIHYPKYRSERTSFSLEEVKIVELTDTDVNYNSTCYVSVFEYKNQIELMFRNTKLGTYQTVWICINSSAPYHNICCEEVFGICKDVSSEVAIYYNEIQPVSNRSYIGIYGMESTIFDTISNSEWGERVPLYVMPSKNDPEPDKLKCNDEELQSCVYHFMERFCREFDSIANKLMYMAGDIISVSTEKTTFSEVADSITPNHISNTYCKITPYAQECSKNLNKRYVTNITQHIKLSDLYDTWFKHVLKKKHITGINTEFDGTLGEFCVNYTTDKVSKTIPGIGPVTVKAMDDTIRARTFDVMYLGMGPLLLRRDG